MKFVSLGIFLAQKKEEVKYYSIQLAKCKKLSKSAGILLERGERPVVVALNQFRVIIIVFIDHQSFQSTFKKKDTH